MIINFLIMKILKIIFFSFFIFIIIIGTDLILYQIFDKNIYKKFNNIQYLSTYYNKDELNKKIPFRHEFHGGICISHGLTSNKMNWHPRIGAQDKHVNVECVNNLFTSKTTNIVFFGGSAMASALTPNYKTSIEYFMFKKNLDKFRTINLAESGARMSNNLSSFIEYIPKFNNVDYIISLDGYNEILPLRYSDNADFDFYWEAGVKERLHNPELFLLNKYLNNSYLNNFFFKEKKKINKKLVKESFNEYQYRKNIFKKLCKIEDIKCIFFFQPTVYNSRNMTGDRISIIKNFFLRNNSKQIHQFFYKLADTDMDIINLDHLFDNKIDIYLDDVHFDKFGNEIIGSSMIKYIK